MRRAVYCIVALAIVAHVSGAQTVRGIVSRSGVPVSGVVLQLLDESGVVLSSSISEIDGRYRVGATKAGRYQVSARRIGFAKHQTDMFTLTVGETRELPIDLSAIAISLDTIRVRPRGCVALASVASDVSTVWEQTKTALLATDATLAARPMGTTVLRYEQIDRGDGPRVRDVSVLESDSTTALWYAPTPRVMRDKGYAVVVARNTIQFWAPSLEVLTSVEFAQDHCARLDDASDATLLYLSFEPTRFRRDIVDIGGRIAIDRRSAELRWLSFRYTNMEPTNGRAEAGGRMEFTRLKDASWLISDWLIRVPVTDSALSSNRKLTDRPLTERERIASMQAIDIAGGRLFIAHRDADTVFSIPFPVLSGIVIDSSTRKSVRNARLFLREAFRETTSDSVGHFSFGRIRPGPHTLQISTIALDSLGASSVIRLKIMDSTSSAQVAVQTLRQAVASMCFHSKSEIFPTTSVLHGVVTLRAADSVATGVQAVWTDPLTRATVRMRTAADSIGQYRFCGVPTGTAIAVHAEQGVTSSTTTSVTIDSASPYRVVPLALEPPRANDAQLRGVVRDSALHPVAFATVSIAELGLRTITDVEGVYRFPHLVSGRYRMSIQPIGYAPMDTSIDVHVNSDTIRIHRAFRLDRREDEAHRALERFEERRKIGVGQFLTRDALARMERRRMSDVVREFRQAIVTPMGSSGALLKNRPGALATLACPTSVWLDERPLYVGGLADPPDLNAFSPQQFEAIEFYIDEKQAPADYRGFARCGVLVLHSRP